MAQVASPRATAPLLAPTVSWSWVWRAVRWPVLLAILLLAVVFVPRVWGWQFRWLATGYGSWSMASDGGVMPLSMYYVAKTDEYSVGDVVSFEYTGSQDQSQNGPSIKQVVAVAGDTCRVAGLNGANSVPPCDVPAEAIHGRIVARWSPVPVEYWRWLSDGWQLSTDKIADREERIFSLQTVANVLTSSGRLANWAAFSFPPDAIRYVAEERAVVETGGRVVVYSAPGQEAYASPVGTTFGGIDSQTLVVNRRGRPEVTRVDLNNLTETTTTAPQAGQRIRLTPMRSKLVRSYFAPVALPARFMTSWEGVERSCSAIPSPDPLGSIVVIIPAPTTDGEIEVEVISIPDEGMQIVATSPN